MDKNFWDAKHAACWFEPVYIAGMFAYENNNFSGAEDFNFNFNNLDGDLLDD